MVTLSRNPASGPRRPDEQRDSRVIVRTRDTTAVDVASIIAAILGVAFVWRTQAALVRWSNIAGVAWAVLYAVLALQEAGDLAAWPSDAATGVVGGLAALIAYRGVRTEGTS